MLENIMLQDTYKYNSIDTNDDEYLEYLDHEWQEENNY